MNPIKLTPMSLVHWMNDILNSDRADYVYVYTRESVTSSNCLYVHGQHVDKYPNILNGDTGEYDVSDVDFSDAVPGCLVSAYLHHMGVPLEEMARHENRLAGQVLAKLAQDRIIRNPSEWVRECLEKAQSYQDQGMPWSESLNNAADFHAYPSALASGY